MNRKNFIKANVLPCVTSLLFTTILYFSNIFGKLSIYLYPFCLIVIPFLYYKRRKIPFRTMFIENKPIFSQAVIGFFLFLGIIILALIANFFYSVYLNLSYLDMLHNAVNGKDNIFKIIFQIAFGEELFFRGFIFDKLKSKTNSKITTIFVSSSLFAFIHFNPNLLGEYTYALVGNIIFCFCVGSLLSYSRFYVKNASVLSTAIAHGLYWAVMPFISQIV